MEIPRTMKANANSIETVRLLIDKKVESSPSFANGNTVRNVITDMDVFPYNRWFRGVYYYSEPVIFEREAGYRKVENSVVNVAPLEKQYESACFQVPCSTQKRYLCGNTNGCLPFGI